MPGEKIKRPTRAAAEAAVRTLIAWAGDDPDRDGLRETPQRVTAAYGELFSGYEDAGAPIDPIVAENSTEQDVVVARSIPFFSHCEHHMVPFTGKAHIAYLPADKVVGPSTLARVVNCFAHRLQTQERLSRDIIGAIELTLKPRGIALHLEAQHQCMTLRGVKAHGASTVTTEFTGVFRDKPQERMRFMNLINGGYQFFQSAR